ncbi:rho GTPase-activating protein 6-like isoform X2 [Carcharodon carcharias]|uniref:rho GTPase-activating protein 6-like isoform X2 n=1 Tax=Carcharodon carcharias TaxID=13397 RepID=UPI001B7F48B5|nr:rho GTPase-activating protein 6-like isoform X2 [Carcharodon carcharias]
MSTQGLYQGGGAGAGGGGGGGWLNTVFFCSSPSAKGISKRKLRQTRSLDSAIIRGYGTDTELAADDFDVPRNTCMRSKYVGVSSPLSPRSSAENLAGSRSLRSRQCPRVPLEKSLSSNFSLDYDPRGGVKRTAAWDLSFLPKNPPQNLSSNTLFSPRKWLQRKPHQPNSQSYIVWRSEGDFTWNSMSGRSVRLKPVPIQSLSELERVRLQEVAFYRLQQDYDLGCQVTIPKDGQKRKKSLRRKLDSLGKEKNKDKEFAPHAFAMPLSQVIVNDRAHKQKQDALKEEQKDNSDFVASVLPFGSRRQNKELSSSNSSLSSTSETLNEPTSPNTPEAAPRVRRRGGMSVDSITDLDDDQSRLLEALQLSLPTEVPNKKEKQRDKKLSLNPIYRQVPRLVDSCCQHLEKYGLQTVGIFRVGSSKKRVRQLREEFDRGADVVLDEEHSVHDVGALLKEFLRDIPDPLLTRELYTPFISTLLLEQDEQLSALQLLIYLLPPCNCDTLHRLMEFLAMVTNHAEDTLDKDGQEVTGNKMTSLNLATIFGPNLLHKQKSSDKEFSVQSSARAEESAAIINVVQKVIENYETLFMVPPELQNEVLMSLLETDPDVVDYLLRRKASQSSSPDLTRAEVSYSLGGRHSSTDSNKISSGEVSPYDNNSPVLSDRLLMQRPEDLSPGSEKLYKVPEQYALVGHLKSKSGDSSPVSWPEKGSYGDIYQSSGLQQRQCSLSQGNLIADWPVVQASSTVSLDNAKQPVRRTHTTAGAPECRPHAPVSRVCSSPQVAGNKKHVQLSLESLCLRRDLRSTGSAEQIPQKTSETSFLHKKPWQSHFRHGDINRNETRPPPPYPGPLRESSLTSSKAGTHQEQALSRLQTTQQSSEEQKAMSPKQSTLKPEQQDSVSCNDENRSWSSQTDNQNNKNNLAEPDWVEWQRERWQIWELLSADSADSLPETLV